MLEISWRFEVNKQTLPCKASLKVISSPPATICLLEMHITFGVRSLEYIEIRECIKQLRVIYNFETFSFRQGDTTADTFSQSAAKFCCCGIVN